MMFVIGAVALAIALLALHRHLPRLRQLIAPSTSPVPLKSKEKEEKEPVWGVWSPVKFQYPKVTPWTLFDVDTTKPIPFRPFRWGPNYPINMGIRPMHWDTWIQLDSDYRKTLAIRAHRTAKQGDLATRTLPGYREQALECLLEISSFLAERYPQYYTITRRKYIAAKPETHGDSFVGEEGGAVATITNLITNEHWDFEELDRTEPGWNPMKIAGLLQQDDLACMVEGSDGQYFFQAGSICTAGFWRLEDKIGLSLEDIHSRGVVPKWKEKLKFSMERFFQKMKHDKPVQRNNYFFQIDDQLGWSSNTNGPEKIFDQGNKGPVPSLLAASEDPSWKAPAPTDDPNDVWFRTERQTLRRMPKTGCILFTIRTYFHKVADIANEPGVPGRMASAIRSWPEDVAKYKGSDLYTPILLPYLDDLHDKQLELGIGAKDEEEQEAQTDKYPF
ncbi:hypothetical protein T439DRAFT_329704 [Meredithblackwellia eburnea MCA 4105]